MIYIHIYVYMHTLLYVQIYCIRHAAQQGCVNEREEEMETNEPLGSNTTLL